MSVAVPIPPISKSPIFTVKLPAPMVSAAATVRRLRLWLKSTLFSPQIRAPVTAIRPNRTIARPPRTAHGIVPIRAPNFGEKPSTIATTAAITKTSVE